MTAVSAHPEQPRATFEDLQQAATWFALLQSESATAGDRLRWEAWLRKDGGARAAWQQVEAVSRDFSSVRHLPARQILEDTRATATRRRRSALRVLALLPIAGVAGWLLEREVPWRGWVATYRTQTGERREIVLEDGSRLWLNTASAVDVDFTPTHRRILLHAGEVLVSTGHDPAWEDRPLVVEVAQGRLTALGTRFTVQGDGNAADSALVTVFEGAVRVQPARGGPSLTLLANEQTRLFIDRVDAPAAADAGSDSWTRGQLVANDMRLGDFIDALARHRRGHLACAPAVRDLRIVGSYPLADTDRILAALQATLPVRVNRVLPWWVTIEPAQGPDNRH
ncbi:FecR family protein [Variovorax sp. PDC80]|uniref:FecR domain-containing protein n=1 Tax=Variovorax sp. PDC80 TaxID=1882827 RepID=UPI0008E9ED76|nr:FecR domain-containing protein [Variovorax sp. PDC80]SFP76448.1 FecR family protein [Variovorax sp. PDC80]